MATDEGSSLNRPYNLGPPNSFVAPPTDLPSSAPTIGLLQIPVVQPTFINFSNNCEEPISEEEAKRRRELLARRPSYRKILNDLSGYELEIKPKLDTCTPEQPGDALGVVNSSGPTAVHSSVILPSSMPDGIADTTRSLMSHGATSGLLHYAQTTDGNGQILLPSTFVRGDVCRGVKLEPYDFAAVSGDLLGLKPVSSSSALSAPAARSAGAAAAAAALVNQGLLPAFTPPSDVNCSSPSKSSSSTPNPSGPEEAVRKRELRLLKNREAAKECRRKKKEYVKCLESRVTVLETQNKQLIEELKNLKELYCQKAD
ncbi:Cyclic AMP-responsive element-binding protein 1 [Trichinella pseudospiralis]|uniref:Cyclic AMP-responsive element-binding protein 1 n=1 Tax=Trichinella pseudospiralis TaxID=6337 RepID=A0A0V1I2Z1_TRIPS|nr:Cyclic AMP-responsive element-binding protein 1 [Trichinella pseudospiralis]